MTNLSRILSDYVAGISVPDLAAWYGVDEVWVRGAVGYEPTPHLDPTAYSDDLFIEAHAAGLTTLQITRRYGCSKHLAHSRQIRLGLTPNRIRGKQGES